MNDKEQKLAAKKFAEDWEGKGYEKGDSQKFWLALLNRVYGIAEPDKYISFEDKIKLDNTSFIDGYIPSKQILIEQKSLGKSLKTAILQSDGTKLTPFQQAKRYSANLPFSKRPRWIITCNFESFLVYDMENPNSEPEEILLKDLETDYYRLNILVDDENPHLKKELEVSIKAGDLVGVLYEKILEQYNKISMKENSPDEESILKSLNVLCVRLVFCLYAEDAGLFGKKSMFHDYLEQFDAKNLRGAIIKLFKILNQKKEDRDPYEDERLLAFPYVNGGLFADDSIIIPQFTDEIRTLLLENASDDFDWSQISPTIFGAVFESTLNPETRRSGGMHYTSIENIHKVIDPLFLDDLKYELLDIKEETEVKTKKRKLENLHNKLAKLKFLDPACGSGNFLTETYLSIRRLENEIIKMKIDINSKKGDSNQIRLVDSIEGLENPIRVSISQFSGIEINDFAVTVAKTALWIAESQMMDETSEILHMPIDFLPLKSYANIVEGNALRIDWNDVVDKSELDYIMGNPPFVGFTYMSDNQKQDLDFIFPGIKNLDFVCCWYKKANDYIKNTKIDCGFVSTNSISQGETVARLWEFLNFKINFAYQSFVWNSEANNKAHVHCIIIGFSDYEKDEKLLYCGDTYKVVKNINPYLKEAPNVIVKSRNKPISQVPKMVYGNKPADGGNLIIEEKDYDEFIKKDPNSKKYIKPLLGAVEFLHNKKRYCLWLKNTSPAELKKCPLIMNRIKKCKENREQSKAAGIRKFAQTPTLFAQITQPEGEDYILIPRVSSEKRRYIPMAFLTSEIIVSDAVQIVPNAKIYHFGILTSNVHMAWMRTVCGRLKSDYRYSKDIVYNNFPWPEVSEKDKSKIEETAQAILDARELYPDSSLADLYDETLMPAELLKAHRANDRAVMNAYGFTKKGMTESECVSELMKLYVKKLEELEKNK